jgi:hypothetical protein
MTKSTSNSKPIAASASAKRRNFEALIPAMMAMAYPFLLRAFHSVVLSSGSTSSTPRYVGAAAILALAFAMPLSGLFFAYRFSRSDASAPSLRARRLAFLSITAPPLFVFIGVAPGLVGLHPPEAALWIGIWLVAASYGISESSTRSQTNVEAPPGRWRVTHGISGALILCFVLFHLTNHLFGLIGPDAHATVMHIGRKIYRATFIEPVLVLLLLFQVASGVRLAWRWSGLNNDVHRIFQIGSGVYLSVYIVTHLNSALISARAVHKIDTNWDWASGAPIGLIHDAWDIRLLPHYALGVFFIVGHLFSALRIVMLAHGSRVAIANRVWIAGLGGGAVLAAMIIGALCGLRI